MNKSRQWRIIACQSSDYRHIVHDDGFVWLMFLHERFSMSEQTLNSQNHGAHYMSVITWLTCNNSILLTRNSPDWQTYRDDTADDTVCSGSVYFWHFFRDDGFTLMACVRSQRKHTHVLADTRVITYVIPSLSHLATEIYRSLSLCHVTWIDQSRTSIHPETLKSLKPSSRMINILSFIDYCKLITCNCSL